MYQEPVKTIASSLCASFAVIQSPGGKVPKGGLEQRKVNYSQKKQEVN